MSACCRSLTSASNRILPSLSHRVLFSQSQVSEFPRISAIYRLNRRREIVLRSRLWVVEQVAPAGGGTAFESDSVDALVEKTEKVTQCCSYAAADQVEDSGNSEKEEKRSCNRTAEVIIAAAFTVVLGVGNRVLYKLALVPLKRYPFFLAQLATFGYVLVYFSILHLRYHAGKVTNEMLALPKTPYVAVGLFEALGAACGMAAGANLSGAAIPILSQSFLIWQLLLSFIFLGRRYSFNQLLGCFLVAVGLIITVASGSSSGSLIEAGIFWSLLMIISFLFQAADAVLKEIIFLNAANNLEGGTVDVFVVNSFGSAFQAIFICLLLPFLSNLWGIPFDQLSSYLKNGAACFLNLRSVVRGCDGAPLLPVLFVIVNMGFNVSLLYLLKISSAVVSCLASTVSVPIAVFLFTLPMPYLGPPSSSLPSGFVAGAIILVMGMLIYVWTPLCRAIKDYLRRPC